MKLILVEQGFDFLNEEFITFYRKISFYDLICYNRNILYVVVG